MNIETKVKEIVAAHLGHDVAAITVESKIEGDLGADSLDVIEIIMACEDHFQISIEEYLDDGASTVADLVKLVSRLTGALA